MELAALIVYSSGMSDPKETSETDTKAFKKTDFNKANQTGCTIQG